MSKIIKVPVYESSILKNVCLLADFLANFTFLPKLNKKCANIVEDSIKLGRKSTNKLSKVEYDLGNGLSIPENLWFDAPHGHISNKIDTKVKLAKKIRKQSKNKKNPPSSSQKSDRTSKMDSSHSKTYDLIPLLAIL